MNDDENSDFWRISGAANGTTEVWIHGYIGESLFSESTSARDFVNTLNQVKSKKVKVFLNSRGGSVVDGITIFNALVSHNAEVTTVNMGSAMSIAALILQAGDKRQSFGNAITMVHDSSTGMYGNAKDHRKTADVLEKFNKLISTTFESKGISKDNIQAMMDGNDHYYTATEAEELGLIDAVTDHLSVSASEDSHFAIPDHLASHSERPQPPSLLEKVKGILGAQKPKETQTNKEEGLGESVLALAEKQQTDSEAFDQKISAIDEKFTALNEKLIDKLDQLTNKLSKEPKASNARPPATGSEDSVLTDC